MTVRPHNTIPDWYIIPGEWHKKYLSGVPGVYLHKDGRMIHRSHLALVPATENEKRPVWFMPPQFPNDELRDYQQQAVDFIHSRRSTLVNYTPRLGKTAIAVGAHRPEDGQLVVVAPLSTRHVWLDWFKRRWPDVTPAVLRGRKFDPALLNSPVVFVNYDITTHWQTWRLNIGTLVIDEAHFVANNRSKRSKAVQFFAAIAKRVILLTGTPIYNRLDGLWSMLHMMAPGAWGSYFEFTARYCEGRAGEYGWDAKGSSHQEELQARLTGCMISKTWRDVAKDLPPTTRSLELVSVTFANQLSITDAARQARDDTRQETLVGEVARLRRLLGQLKIKKAVELVSELLANDEPVVVWVWHKDVAQQLTEKLQAYGPTVCITGDTVGDRGEWIDKWKNLGTAALVINLAVGQVGIDLSHARHAVFAEQDWTPAVLAQAEMRTFSPDRPMFITHLIADHAVDIKVMHALLEKVRLANLSGFAIEEAETVNIFLEALGDDAITLWRDDDPVSWLLDD